MLATVLLIAVIALFSLGLGILIPLLIGKIRAKSRTMQLKQAESVYKHLLNNSTAAFMEDVLSVEVGGLQIADGRSALQEAFPKLIDSLEKTRTKNPEAWFRIVQLWLPLIMMKQQGQAQANKALASLTMGGNGVPVAPGPGLMQGVLGGMMGGAGQGPKVGVNTPNFGDAN